jgi:RNA polymerase sigma factor (sigma-70 family)
MTDETVLQRIKEDDSRIISKLYVKYHDEFIGFIRKNFPDISGDVVEDIFSDSFHALYRNIKSGRLVNLKCSIKTYLFQIGKYKAIDELKRQKRSVSGEFIDYRPPEELKKFDFIDDSDEQVLKNRLLHECVSGLKPPCKVLLELFWFENMRDTEIVAETDYKDTRTVKNQRSRCMKTLREKYKAAEKENLIRKTEMRHLIDE